jgi:hypothetical protein
VSDGANMPSFHSVPTKEMTVQLTNLSYGATLTSESIPDWKVQPSAHFETDTPVLWIFGQRNSITSQLGSCSTAGGVILTSNAPNTTDPTWDDQNQSINVRINAPHLKSNGDLNVGYLEIRIPRVMAQCMWHTDLAEAVSAKIDVTYDDGGTPSVVAVAGKIDGSDYVVITSGFHYSSPKLSIKLRNMPGAQVSSTPAPTAVAAVPAKTTIICVKGKIIKKVAGTSPKCPAGFSRK